MAMAPQQLMRLATVASTAVALTLVGAKAVAWVVTDSVSMLSSLVDTSLDLVGSLVTFFAVRQALVPPMPTIASAMARRRPCRGLSRPVSSVLPAAPSCSQSASDSTRPSRCARRLSA